MSENKYRVSGNILMMTNVMLTFPERFEVSLSYLAPNFIQFKDKQNNVEGSVCLTINASHEDGYDAFGCFDIDFVNKKEARLIHETLQEVIKLQKQQKRMEFNDLYEEFKEESYKD